jgi:hypothetical protein
VLSRRPEEPAEQPTYNDGMDPRAVRDYMTRHWADAADSKRAYWADRFRDEGWRSVWVAAQGLLAHTRQVRPDFPTVTDRERDWRDHATLRAQLDRAAHAFARR